jgi:hypothetical protein
MLSNPSCYSRWELRGGVSTLSNPAHDHDYQAVAVGFQAANRKKEQPQRGGAAAFILLLDMIPADGGIHIWNHGVESGQTVSFQVTGLFCIRERRISSRYRRY